MFVDRFATAGTKAAGATASARSRARWESDGEVWIDHATVTEDDIDWLAAAVHLVVWAVRFPARFLSKLPALESLDYRGGSAEDASFVEGCNGLRSLSSNQVRGLADVSSVSTLDKLEYLDLYGLPRVLTIPSFRRLRSLRQVSLGSMKGLESMSGLFDAPGIEDVQFLRTVRTRPSDAEAIRDSPTIRTFRWLAEDVPDRVWVPFVELANRSGDAVKKETT
jgi:hypothetical protein